MRYDFKSSSCFSHVGRESWYPGFAVVGELGSDDAMLPWFLLVTFLHLPFVIWLSLLLTGLALSDCELSVLQACVSILLGFPFSLCTQVCRHSWETSSLVVVFVHVAPWPRISSVLSGLSTILVCYLSPCATCLWHTMAEDGLQLETENGRILPEGSWQFPLSTSGGPSFALRPLWAPAVG